MIDDQNIEERESSVNNATANAIAKPMNDHSRIENEAWLFFICFFLLSFSFGIQQEAYFQ